MVGNLLPGRGDCVGCFLSRAVLAGITLGQFILCNRVVLEDARDAGLDCCVRMVVTVCVRAEIVFDISPVVASRFPLVELEVRGGVDPLSALGLC